MATNTPMANRYRAFISYSHADEKWAKWLLRSLEAYRVPRHIVERYALDTNRLIPIFRDREELASSGDLSATIQNALTESASLIVICSPAAAASRWVNEEVKVFKQMGKGDQVFCLLVGDPANSFPPEVLVDTDGDGIATAEETEPLAADPGSDADGKAGAKLKLISGLLNVGLDELRQRENRRRYRRLAFISAGSIAAMVIAVALSVLAVVSRNEATRQQAVAEREAVTSQQVTDFLIDLFRSSDPFVEPGTDLKATEILARGAQKIGRELQDEPVVRSRLLSTIGKVYMQLGFYDEAGTYLDEALATEQSLVEPDSGRLRRINIDRAWLATETQDLLMAQDIYDELLPPVSEGERLSDVVAANEDWAALVNDFGVLQWTMGRYEEAIVILTQAVELNTRVYGDVHSSIALTLQNLGLALQEVGKHDEARRVYERALAMQIEIDGPDHPILTVTLLGLASTVRRLGDLEAAKSYLAEGLRIAEAAFDAEHPAIGYLRNGLGIVLYKLEDYERALEVLDRAGKILLKTKGLMHSATGANLQHRARVFVAIGKVAEAKELYEQSVRSYEGSLGPEHPEIIGVYAELAEVLAKLGEIEDAKRLYERAITVADMTLPATHPYAISLSEDYGEFLQRVVAK